MEIFKALKKWKLKLTVLSKCKVGAAENFSLFFSKRRVLPITFVSKVLQKSLSTKWISHIRVQVLISSGLIPVFLYQISLILGCPGNLKKPEFRVEFPSPKVPFLLQDFIAQVNITIFRVKNWTNTTLQRHCWISCRLSALPAQACLAEFGLTLRAPSDDVIEPEFFDGVILLFVPFF